MTDSPTSDPNLSFNLGDSLMTPSPPSLPSEMEILRQLMEQMVLSNNHQEQLMKHLTPTTTNNGTQEKELKVAPPVQYDGSPEKLCTFLISLELVFGANPVAFRDNRKKIYYVLSYMQAGIAQKWVDNKLEDVRNGKVRWLSYKEFEGAVRNHFETTNRAEDAQLAIENLVQGSSTAESFFEYFETYKRDSGYNDAALIRYIKKNLNPHLLQSIYNQTPLPRMYNEWKRTAIQKDRQWREMKSNVGGNRSSGNHNLWFNNRTPLSHTDSGTTGRSNTAGMTGGAVGGAPHGGGSHPGGGGATAGHHDGGSHGTHSGGLSHSPTATGVTGGAGAPMDIDRQCGGRIGAGECFICHESGHFARNCPRRPTGPPRRSL